MRENMQTRREKIKANPHTYKFYSLLSSSGIFVSCQGSLNYPFKNSINKNLWHPVIAYISVLASCMAGISKTRASGSEVLRNQRPTCLQCPALFLASTSTNVSLVLCQFIPIFWLPPSQNRTRNRSAHIHVSLPYSQFPFPEKTPEMCAFLQGQALECYGSSSGLWTLAELAPSHIHSLLTHSLLTRTFREQPISLPLPSLGSFLLPLSQKVPQSNMFPKFEPLKGRFYRMFNQKKKRDNSGFKILIFSYKMPTYS